MAAPVFVDGVTPLNAAQFNALGAEVNVKQGAFSYGAAPPGSPADGDIWILPADATNGVMWMFRYRAGSASAYKWEFVGGAPMEAGAQANESTASTTPIELTTKQRLTLPRGGDYLARFGCSAYGPINVNAFVYLVFAGAAVTTLTLMLPVAGGQTSFPTREARVIGRAAGEVADIRYSIASGTVNVLERSFTLTPIRIF